MLFASPPYLAFTDRTRWMVERGRSDLAEMREQRIEPGFGLNYLNWGFLFPWMVYNAGAHPRSPTAKTLGGRKKRGRDRYRGAQRWKGRLTPGPLLSVHLSVRKQMVPATRIEGSKGKIRIRRKREGQSPRGWIILVSVTKKKRAQIPIQAWQRLISRSVVSLLRRYSIV